MKCTKLANITYFRFNSQDIPKPTFTLQQLLYDNNLRVPIPTLCRGISTTLMYAVFGGSSPSEISLNEQGSTIREVSDGGASLTGNSNIAVLQVCSW